MILAVLWGRARAVAFSNALGDLVVPLLLRPTVQQANDDHGHVVASDASSFTVCGKTVVHHVLTDVMQVLSCGDTPPDKLNHGLRSLAIPDSYEGSE